MLAARGDEIARRAVALMLEATPAYAARLDARAKRACEEDAGLHVRALIGSLAAGEPLIFADYAVWAAELLSRVGIGAEELVALFAATGRAIAELVPAAGTMVRPHLEAGERALTH